jgi:hypothetical protein
MGKKERTKPRTKPTAGGIWQCAGLAAAAAALAAAALRLAAPAGPQALAPPSFTPGWSQASAADDGWGGAGGR